LQQSIIWSQSISSMCTDPGSEVEN